jgi:protein-L-isoaspartate(D-aspartate) O-methyltransferase
MHDMTAGDTDQLAGARERMLALLRRHIGDERLLAAFAAVPRERFVPGNLIERAYDDAALPIGREQTISQPLIVALMLGMLELMPADRVLEVGTGSGYQAALLSLMVRQVVTVERDPSLLERAQSLLASLGYGNVLAYLSGDELGRRVDAPFDAIVVSAGAPRVPRELIDQLSREGRMIVPVGPMRAQELVLVRRTAHGVELARRGRCGFVPLIGRGAWPSSSAEASGRPKVG